MRFKSGFSDPAFRAGGMSEFDRAIEIGAKALYEFEPQINAGAPITWDKLSEHVRERMRRYACVVLRSVNGM